MTAQPLELANEWRKEAESLRRRGAEPQAAALESCAEDLEEVAREYDLEALTLEQATQESGYSYSALQKQVASGQLRNLGSKHQPRVRRGDLPRKGRVSERAVPLLESEPDLADTVLAHAR